MNRTQISLQQAVGKTITACVMSKDESSLLMAIGESEFVWINTDRIDDWTTKLDAAWQFDADSFVLADLSKVFDSNTIHGMINDRMERDLQRVYAANAARCRAEAAAQQSPVDRRCKGRSRMEDFCRENGINIPKPRD